MHEVSVMESAMEIAVENARAHNAQQIHRMVMRVGALSSVVPDALEFAFEIVTKGTMAEGATLEIEHVPAVCYCSTCKIEYEPHSFFYECPQCNQPSADIRHGKELELAYLEVS